MSRRPDYALVGAGLGVQNYVIAVSDTSVMVIRTALQTGVAKELVIRLPRATRLGPFTDNGVITVGGIEMFVWGLSDLLAVQAADNEIGYECPGPPSPW